MNYFLKGPGSVPNNPPSLSRKLSGVNTNSESGDRLLSDRDLTVTEFGSPGTHPRGGRRELTQTSYPLISTFVLTQHKVIVGKLP